MGEYLSKKENTSILHAFVHSFNLKNTRIDQAVRQYMETFRLPGEAPLISLLLEKFAEHWHVCIYINTIMKRVHYNYLIFQSTLYFFF